MNSSDKLHRLLHIALIEIREQGRAEENKVVFRLADLLHNVPLQLGSAVRGERSFDDVISMLHARARNMECDRWLNRRLTEIDMNEEGWNSRGKSKGSEEATEDVDA